MSNAWDEYEDGLLHYTVQRLTSAEVAASFQTKDWADGFLAFSRGEKRLRDPALNNCSLNELLGERVKGVGGVDGYLMEATFWRKNGTRYEEISIEREDRGFFVQRWELFTACPAEEVNCYYRKTTVDRYDRAMNIFGGKPINAFEVFEVVVRGCRLNFFVTTGVKTG